MKQWDREKATLQTEQRPVVLILFSASEIPDKLLFLLQDSA